MTLPMGHPHSGHAHKYVTAMTDEHELQKENERLKDCLRDIKEKANAHRRANSLQLRRAIKDISRMAGEVVDGD